MDNRKEVREFLASRRARVSPEHAGLPAYGGNRRVPGLRREEVALLAGISIDYYIRLERGNRAQWASQNVRFHQTGVKDIHHPGVRDLSLSFEAMDLPADPGLSLIVYSAEPGSAAQDSLNLLASWTATPAVDAMPPALTAQTPPQEDIPD